MGTFDTVRVPCPNCGMLEGFQSKGALRPCMEDYDLLSAPADVLSNVNRHSPHQCANCSAWFAVDEEKREAIHAEAPDPLDHYPINDWYIEHDAKKAKAKNRVG